MITNVHERRIAAPRAELATLLATLGSDDDRMWHTRLHLPMRLDRGLALGSTGGHSDIRYTVEAWEPGERVVFRFDPACGLDGTHAFELEDAGAGPGDGDDDEPTAGVGDVDGTPVTVVRHVIRARALGTMRVSWPVFIRAAHDTVFEDVFDHLELTLTGVAHRSQPVPPVIRALLPLATATRRLAGRTA